MANFTVLFEYFAHYDDEDLNESELNTEYYDAESVSQVIEEIEEDEEFDDSEIVDPDYMDQLTEAGRNIIYIKDENDNIVYSRKSGNVELNLIVDFDELLDEEDISEDEFERLMALPEDKKEIELQSYIAPISKDFSQQFQTYIGSMPDYVSQEEKSFEDLILTIKYKFKDDIEVGKLEYMIKVFSEELSGAIILYDYDNEYYANYREGEVDSGGFLAE